VNERAASWSRNSASRFRSRSPPNTTRPAAPRLCCGPYLGLGEKRPPSNPARPCGKSAARAGCVQRNIRLSELRQIVRFYRVLQHRCVAAFGGVTAPIAPICVPQAKQTWRSQCLARLSPLRWWRSCSRPPAWRPPRLRPPRASASAQARTRALPSRASLQLRTRSFNGYYNMAPTDRYLYGSAPRRHAAPENGAVR